MGPAAVDREVSRVVIAGAEHARRVVAEQIEYCSVGRGRAADPADAAEHLVERMRRDGLKIIGAYCYSVGRIEIVAGRADPETDRAVESRLCRRDHPQYFCLG